MEDNTYIDAEDFTSSIKQEITFRSVVFQQIVRIIRLASVEFRGGYWNKKPVMSSGGTVATEAIYVPDSREEFCNAVYVLHHWLFPHFDKPMIDMSEKLKETRFSTPEEKIKVFQDLFKELSCFLHRKKYFDIGGIDI